MGSCKREVDLVVLLCCHNRREKTVRVVENICGQESPKTIRAAIVLVDDGSIDGTAAAVLAKAPQIMIANGDGNLYWSRGMALAQREASGTFNAAYFLWLNDDVILESDAVVRLLAAAAAAGDRAIVVGALADPLAGTQTTYSAFRRSGRRPLALTLVQPSGTTITGLDTFNGNVVLVPRSVYQAVGAVDEGFAHGYGDLDYGYRARRLGFEIALLPDFIGSCTRNGSTGSWQDTHLPRQERLRQLFGPKGMPIRSHLRFARRHGGKLWLPVALFEILKLVGLTMSGARIGHKRMFGA